MSAFAEIALTQGLFAKVDVADVRIVSRTRWCVWRVGDQTYAKGTIDGRRVLMHRLLLACPPGLVRDHINRDGLDNRRGNLRLCTPRQNAINRVYDTSGRFRGVRQKGSRWRAAICPDRVPINLGSFDSEIEAALVYDDAAAHYFGEFAVLNFPGVTLAQHMRVAA